MWIFPKKVETLDRTGDVGYTFDCFVRETRFMSTKWADQARYYI